MGVQAEEMSVEALAQPVTKFRLYQPVLDLFVIREFPGIVVTGYIESQLLGESDLKSKVSRSGSPIQCIGTFTLRNYNYSATYKVEELLQNPAIVLR